MAGDLDAVGGGTVHGHNTLVNGESMDRCTGGGIEVAFFHGFDDGCVFQFVGSNHDPATGDLVLVPVVQIVSSDGEKGISGHQQVLIDPVVVFIAAAQTGAGVIQLHAPKPLQPGIVGIALHRPCGVVVAHQEAVFIGGSNDSVDAVYVIARHHAGRGGHVHILLRVSIVELGRQPGLPQVILPLGIQIQVVGLSVGADGRLFVDVDLVCGQQQEVFVLQLRVGNGNVVVGNGEDLIPSGLVNLLQLLRRVSAVGDGGVAVQIRAVVVGLGQQMLHGFSSFNSAAKIQWC